MKTLIGFALLAVLVATTGCSQFSLMGNDHDFQMSGTAEGLQAWNDYNSALVTNGKASPDQDTAAWISRRHQETMRYEGLKLGMQKFAAPKPQSKQ